jgi:hypothetical protein
MNRYALSFGFPERSLKGLVSSLSICAFPISMENRVSGFMRHDGTRITAAFAKPPYVFSILRPFTEIALGYVDNASGVSARFALDVG